MDSSATSQALQIPLTMTSSSTVNGQLVSYTAIGINAAGIVFAVWLRFWKQKFGR